MDAPSSAYDPNESTQQELIYALSIPAAITIVVVICRFISRKLSDAPFWWDDWVVLWTFVIWICSFSSESYGNSIGAGRHFKSLPTYNQETMGKLTYVNDLLWGPMLGSAKCAVLCLYLRLFGVNRKFALACKIVMATSITWAVATALVFAFQCVPAQAVWDKSLEMDDKAKCVDLPALFMGTGVTHILLDMTIYLMPTPMIWKLKLDIRHKLGLSLIFMLGAFTTAISIIRVVLIVRIDPVDFTYNYTPLYIWQPLEVDVAIICTCLPIMGPLLKWLFRHRFGLSSIGRSTNRKSTGGHVIVENHDLEAFGRLKDNSSEVDKTKGNRTSTVYVARAQYFPGGVARKL